MDNLDEQANKLIGTGLMMLRQLTIALVLLPLIFTGLVGCSAQPTRVAPGDAAAIATATRAVPTSVLAHEPEPAATSEEVPEPGPETSPPLTSSGAVQALAAELQGLSLADFFEASFRTLTLRSPETVVTMGLQDYYGVEEVRLDDISDTYQQETYRVLALVLEMLSGYDRETLSPAGQVSYDVYRWYLQDELAGEAFIYHDYPATYFPITAVHEDTLRFFTDIHPIRDVQDARDYVTRLGLVAPKIQQLIENLDRRAQMGITPPEFAIQWTVYGDLGKFIATPPQQTGLYTALQQKMMPLSSGTPEEMQNLLAEAEAIIEQEILPAYRDLHTVLTRLQTYPGGDSGAWRLPQGQEYYAYCLRHFTSTDLTAAEIHQLGLQELDRIHGEMRRVFSELGYAGDLSLVAAYDQVARDGGHVAGDEVLRRYEGLIATADQNLESAFDIRPQAGVIVVPDEYGDYYLPPAFDGSRPGAFYAGVGAAGKEAYAMPTLAYHETIPGHHFQIALAQEMKDLPSFRQGLTFTAYAEGWALYAERLAWELGWYASDPYGALGFLQSQAFRAARLVVDTGLHAQGWTFQQAQDFFTENTGFELSDNVNPQHEIARYLVWPGQSTAYYVGYLKMMQLRDLAMQVQGEQFDLKAFHRLVLTNGSMPLEVLEALLVEWLE